MLKGFEFESFPSLEYVLVCFFVSKSTFSGKKEKLFFFRSVRFFYAYCSVFFLFLIHFTSSLKVLWAKFKSMRVWFIFKNSLKSWIPWALKWHLSKLRDLRLLVLMSEMLRKRKASSPILPSCSERWCMERFLSISSPILFTAATERGTQTFVFEIK